MIEVEGRELNADLEVVAVPCRPGSDAPEHRGPVGRRVHRFGNDAKWSQELPVFVPHVTGPEREVEDRA
jgi:hypothetical protein